MSKRYSGKSFKDSSVSKKESLREKKQKKQIKKPHFSLNFNIYLVFLKFLKKKINV